MFGLTELVRDEFLNKNNKKVLEENIEEYLNSFLKNDLIRFVAVHAYVDDDYDNFLKVNKLKNCNKKIIIDYILDNLEKILVSYIKIIKTKDLQQLKYIVKNNNKLINLKEGKLSIYFINLIKRFGIVKAEYDKTNETIKFYMPKEFIQIFNKVLKDKKILEENRLNSNVFKYVNDVVNTYGIVTLSKIYELFCKQMFQIEKELLYHIITSFSLVDELYFYEIDNDVLICGLEFSDEDYARDFYSKQEMDYKNYTKEEFEKISSYTYIKELKSYQIFIGYLCYEYKGIIKDIEIINDFIVFDYISFAQLSIKNADRVFNNNIVKIIDADSKEVEKLLRLMKNIFQECPKWLKKGNV